MIQLEVVWSIYYNSDQDMHCMYGFQCAELRWETLSTKKEVLATRRKISKADCELAGNTYIIRKNGPKSFP